jgi:hypothetical protein
MNAIAIRSLQVEDEETVGLASNLFEETGALKVGFSSRRHMSILQHPPGEADRPIISGQMGLYSRKPSPRGIDHQSRQKPTFQTKYSTT